MPRAKSSKLAAIKKIVKQEVAKELKATRLSLSKQLHEVASKISNIKRID